MFFLEEIFAAQVPVQRGTLGLRSPGADFVLCLLLVRIPLGREPAADSLGAQLGPVFQLASCGTVRLCVLWLPLELLHLQNLGQLLSPGPVLGRTMKSQIFCLRWDDGGYIQVFCKIRQKPSFFGDFVSDCLRALGSSFFCPSSTLPGFSWISALEDLAHSMIKFQCYFFSLAITKAMPLLFNL